VAVSLPVHLFVVLLSALNYLHHLEVVRFDRFDFWRQALVELVEFYQRLRQGVDQLPDLF
jgi:hypothetical protein